MKCYGNIFHCTCASVSQKWGLFGEYFSCREGRSRMLFELDIPFCTLTRSFAWGLKRCVAGYLGSLLLRFDSCFHVAASVVSRIPCVSQKSESNSIIDRNSFLLSLSMARTTVRLHHPWTHMNREVCSTWHCFQSHRLPRWRYWYLHQSRSGGEPSCCQHSEILGSASATLIRNVFEGSQGRFKVGDKIAVKTKINS